MKISKREQVLLIILIILVSFYIFNRGLYQPIKQDTAKLSAENNRLQTLISRQKMQLKSVPDLESERSELKVKYQEMMVKVPEQAYLPETISFLEKSAQDSSVTLQSIYYNALQPAGEPRENSPARACKFELSACGSYYNILTMLSKIEEADRLYVINKMDLNTSRTSSPVKEDELAYSPHTELMPLTLPEESNLVIKMQLTAYYDPALIREINGMPKKAAPGEGRDNPFRP